MSKPSFTETQRFSQWWIWAILLLVNGLFVFGLVWQVLLGNTFGDNPMSNTGIIGTTAVMLLLTFGFYQFRLDTVIDAEGIKVRFFPFHLKHKHYPWAQIAEAKVRSYSPISEYGGWGLRTGGRKRGDALNVSGNQGLQLTFSNGRKLLIGTQKPEQVERVLRELKRWEA